VPHHRVPFERVGPFEPLPVVRRRFWREVALWWPERRVLVCGDALGTVPHYFALGGERLGVHPLLRLTPPRRLGEVEPEHVLCGHGAGVHEDATAAVREALAHSRSRAPRVLVEWWRAG
jgi:glyoxylase-like metal-dependent hydrolase (beta-lactamase superfamily II)